MPDEKTNGNSPNDSAGTSSSQQITVKEEESDDCEVVESPASPVPQNQLMDETARSIFDSVWLGELCTNFFLILKMNDN